MTGWKMKNIIDGDFVFLNPDKNQHLYRGSHGKRMEVLGILHGVGALTGGATFPLEHLVHEDDFLKAVALKSFIQDPSLPIEQVVEVFDALVAEENPPHPVKFWVVYRGATRQFLALHLEDQLATLKSLVSGDGRLF